MDNTSGTPLLHLLDHVLSQNEDGVEQALVNITAILQDYSPALARNLPTDASSLLRSAPDLCRVLRPLLDVYPQMASVASTYDGSLPLHFAASLGNVDIASIILEKYPEAASAANSKGKIPLHYAAREGRKAMVAYFLSRAPYTARIGSDKRKLALHFAAGDGHTEVVEMLLQIYPEGATLPSAKGKLPLHFCARWGHLAIARDLLHVYPNGIRALDWDKSLPLHDAAREGQYKMSRYLLEQYPEALCTANMRGETPLFPAVRSNNVDLVALFIRAWPLGGKHILQNVPADDDVSDWHDDIIELLLRGAVYNFDDCSLLEGCEPPLAYLTEDLTAGSTDSECCTSPPTGGTSTSTKKLKPSPGQTHPSIVQTQAYPPFVARNCPGPSSADATASPGQLTKAYPASLPSYDTSRASAVASRDDIAQLPRSKSPTLEEIRRCKKQGVRKRARSSSELTLEDEEEDDEDYDEAFYGLPNFPDTRLGALGPRTFIKIHAALECCASRHVQEVIIKSRPEDVNRKDDLGRLALHWAVTQCKGLEDAKFCLEHYLGDLTAACVRDRYGRLPLHLAIASKAHVTVISALLQANPPSGVESCRSYDQWYHSMPIELATYFDCDLSTIYELMRVDPGIVHSNPWAYKHHA